jgi:hypothetical protein
MPEIELAFHSAGWEIRREGEEIWVTRRSDAAVLRMRDKGDELKVAEAAGSPLTLVAWIRAAVDLYFTSKAVPLLDYNESRRVP